MKVLKTAVVLGLLSVVLSATAATNDLAVAREALRDGLWSIARLHADKIDSQEARLVVLESFAGEGDWESVGARLAGWKDASGDGFDYYREVVKGDHAAAMSVLKRGGSPEGLVEVKMFEADALAKAGNRVAANGIWREIASSTNVGERAYAVACANLMDVELLRRAYETVKSAPRRRLVGLRLGMALLRDAKTVEEGEKLVRRIVKDAPDADGAREAFLAVADAKVSSEKWKEAADVFREAIDIWPDLSKRSSVHEGRGWVLRSLGRKGEALEAFKRAGELAEDDEARAVARIKEGDVLLEMGREEAAMARYRAVIEELPDAKVTKELKSVIEVRKLEAKGRELYRAFKFAEAMTVFGDVAKADSSRGPRMEFLSVLCLYGQGRDDEAAAKAKALAGDCKSSVIRLESMLWLAKFLFNRREWKESRRHFLEYSDAQVPEDRAAEALLWAARAAVAEKDYNGAILLSTRLVERYPDSKAKAEGLLLQGETLVEQARFDEAVLVCERVAASDAASSELRLRAQMLRADALYAMGADNASRYGASLEAYRAIRFGGALSASDQLVVSFRIARALEKLRRMDEAVDQYYTQVVLAYRSGRREGVHYSDEARAAFSRAAFRLADEYEGRGRDRQAANILELVAESDVPAAVEARKRMERLSSKGAIL